MGLIRQGVLGGFRKKTGSVVGSYWRKLDVIKALPRLSSKAPSQQQIEQKQKFAMVTAFLSKAVGLINTGFKSADSLTPMNKAVAYHLKEAVIGTYPDYAIDLAKFMYSKGSLEQPFTVAAEVITGNKIRFTWDRTTDVGDFISTTDTVTVVAYNLDRNTFVKQVAATTRSTGQYELELPAVFETDTLHLYISFSSVIKKINSDSQYLGTASLIQSS